MTTQTAKGKISTDPGYYPRIVRDSSPNQIFIAAQQSLLHAKPSEGSDSQGFFSTDLATTPD
jgi:hypothetical protein